MATINITVQSLLNTAVYNSYAVDNAGTIGELKASIEATTDCSVDWFDLVFNESVLATAPTIVSYGIVEGSRLRTHNKIDRLATKELRQNAKLDLAALDRAASGNDRSTYDITQLPDTYNGNVSGADDNPNTGGLVTGRPWTFSGESSYALSGADNVNEGSGLTFSFSISNASNGTYYWTIETNAGDFATTSGSFTVAGNAGTFTVTPTADSITEGSETFTVAVRSGSTSGSILVSTSAVPATINDTSLTPPPETIAEIFTGETTSGVVTVLETQFEASDGTNFIPSNPADGDTFTQWTDANSGTHNANAIGGATTRASYESDNASLQNSLSVVRFDGVNDGLSINPYPGLVSKAGITVFALVKTAQETGSVNNLDPRVFSTNVSNGLALYYNSASNLWTVAASTGVGASTTTNDHTKFNIHTLVYDGSLTGNANRLKYRHNGVQNTLTFTGTVGATTSASITTMYLGNANGANYWKGDMAEYLLFTRTLTTQEIQSVESYLTNKWGL